MKQTIALFFFLAFWSCSSREVTVKSEAVRLNSLGFLPESSKQASVNTECSKFEVRDAATEKVVFTGKTTGPQFQQDVNEKVWTADFSSLTTPGQYYVSIPGVGNSVKFPIGNQVYNQAYVTTLRSFYLWRCGMEVSGDHNGIHYQQDACHMNDGFDDYPGKPGNKRDGTGGWHDAGDYGKYVVNAGVTVGILFMAWEHFKPSLEKIKLGLPETAPGIPEFLKEMKWETDWLLKMQYPDGSGRVSHKLTAVNFEPFIMPGADASKRYFTDWSSAATADFAAMMAQASRAFKPYDAAYSEKCLQAARVSYKFLKENPDNKGFVQGDFKTGGYQTDDPDDRLWAAAEMWETTGEAAFLADFEKQAAKLKFRVDENWDWGNQGNLGMFTYLLSDREGKNPAIQDSIKENCLNTAGRIVNHAIEDVYHRPLGGRYYWGCNGTIARQTVNIFVANQLNPDPAYLEIALDAIGHLFGRNYYNRSYVTGLGINPPMNPHDRRSGADNIKEPWPGYLVGGGLKATDWVDLEASYSRNEICINWQAPLVFALAWFVNP
jgi:endoglucanase